MSSITSSKPDIRVLDPDTHVTGDPAMYRLPLGQYAYLHEEEPCHLAGTGDSMPIDRVWIVSRYDDDIMTIDQDPETSAANRGFITSHVLNPIDPLVGGFPRMLSQDSPRAPYDRRSLSRPTQEDQ
jgi:hypothetical protein